MLGVASFLCILEVTGHSASSPCLCMVQGQQLVCSGFGCSNMLACINDGRADPMSPEASKRDRAASVQLLPVAVCRWPFLFMITSEDVTPGGCVDYSLCT